MSQSSKPPEVKYRPNVALLLLDEDDKLLICERIGKDGAWQFPQGGVDEGEDLITGLHREVWEEIGLKPEDYELIDQRGGYRYTYPEEVREKKMAKHGYMGQEQTYYLCRLNAKKSKIDVEQSPPEFQDTNWIKPKKFKLDWLPSFKRAVYKQVLIDFFDCDVS